MSSKRRIPSVRRLEEVFGPGDDVSRGDGYRRQVRERLERVREELERWRDTDVDATTTLRKATRILQLGELGVIVGDDGEDIGLFLPRYDEDSDQPTLMYRQDRGTMSIGIPGELVESLRRNGDDDDDDIEPEEGDIFVQDKGNGTVVSCEGKVIYSSRGSDYEEMERAIREWMERQSYWPSVWHVSDHGNVSPYVFEELQANAPRTVPSLAAIKKAFGRDITTDEARDLLRLLMQLAYWSGVNMAAVNETSLEINKLLRGHGWEAFEGRKAKVLYLNMGDLYYPTVVVDQKSGKIKLTDIGSIMEKDGGALTENPHRPTGEPRARVELFNSYRPGSRNPANGYLVMAVTPMSNGGVHQLVLKRYGYDVPADRREALAREWAAKWNRQPAEGRFRRVQGGR